MKYKSAVNTNTKTDIQKIIQISALILFLIISLSIVAKQNILHLFFKGSNQAGGNIKSIEIFSDSSGNPILAMGNCSQDSDCSPTGCSSHICSDHSVTTTCELGEFPEKETYACGCQDNRCVWYRYR